jgi:hypothetical protein
MEQSPANASFKSTELLPYEKTTVRDARNSEVTSVIPSTLNSKGYAATHEARFKQRKPEREPIRISEDPDGMGMNRDNHKHSYSTMRSSVRRVVDEFEKRDDSIDILNVTLVDDIQAYNTSSPLGSIPLAKKKSSMITDDTPGPGKYNPVWIFGRGEDWKKTSDKLERVKRNSEARRRRLAAKKAKLAQLQAAMEEYEAGGDSNNESTPISESPPLSLVVPAKQEKPHSSIHHTASQSSSIVPAEKSILQRYGHLQREDTRSLLDLDVPLSLQKPKTRPPRTKPVFESDADHYRYLASIPYNWAKQSLRLTPDLNESQWTWLQTQEDSILLQLAMVGFSPIKAGELSPRRDSDSTCGETRKDKDDAQNGEGGLRRRMRSHTRLPSPPPTYSQAGMSGWIRRNPLLEPPVLSAQEREEALREEQLQRQKESEIKTEQAYLRRKEKALIKGIERKEKREAARAAEAAAKRAERLLKEELHQLELERDKRGVTHKVK